MTQNNINYFTNMVLSTDTFIDDSFIQKIIFLSNVHYNELTKDYSFAMGYMNKNEEIRAFDLRFDKEDEANLCREEVKQRILRYR